MLPIEIWHEIGRKSCRTYWVLVRCCKQFIQDTEYMKGLFTVRYIRGIDVHTKLPNGWLHSIDGKPAVVSHDMEAYYWCIDGKLHRDNDQPAIIFRNVQQWYQHGRRHRINKPAVIIGCVYEEWYNDGVRHYDFTS